MTFMQFEILGSFPSLKLRGVVSQIRTHTQTHARTLDVSVRSDEHSSIDGSWQWYFPQATVALETDITSRLLSYVESFRD
jgi:hypothetical protein